MTINNELKPCPFCGGAVNIIYHSVLKEYHVYHTGTEDCNFDDLIIDGARAESLSDAYKIWNTRNE